MSLSELAARFTGGHPMFGRLIRRKVVLLGKSIPAVGILLAVAAVGAAAWALAAIANMSFSLTTAPSEVLLDRNTNYVCTLESGTDAVIDECSTANNTATVEVSGLTENDLGVTVHASFTNPQTVPVCLDGIVNTNPNLSVGRYADNTVIPAGATEDMGFEIDGMNLGPNMTVDVPLLELQGHLCP